MSNTDKQQATCEFCRPKAGLPILPLRYAVARADMGKAPKLAAAFGQGVKDIKLPAERAHYTLRLLRPGYLYLYDPRYGKRGWRAWEVYDGGYLWEFNPYIEPPPRGWQRENMDCSRNGKRVSNARLITIAEATDAKEVWLGYSEVMWTQAVLDKHLDEKVRKAHMRRIDVASLRAGTDQTHATKLEKLADRVAEYATTPQEQVDVTTAYVKKYLPRPFRNVRQLLAGTDEAKLAYKLLSPLIRNLTPYATGSTPQKHNHVKSAAWAFAGDTIYADKVLAGDLEQQATSAIEDAAKAVKEARDWKPGMVALDDPAGIATDLGGLIQQLTAEFSEIPERKWKHDTAATIQMIEQQVRNGAVEGAKNAFSTAYSPHHVSPSEARFGHPELVFARKQIDAAEHPDKYTLEERNQLDGWHEYAKLMRSPEAPEQVLKQFQAEWSAHEAAIGLPALDQSWLAWVASSAFKHHFHYNFDSTNLFSGMAFAEVLGTVIYGLGGRTAIAAYLTQAVQQDPSNAENLFVRGLALNHDALIKSWVDGVGKVEITNKNDALSGAVMGIYASWSAVMGERDPAAHKSMTKYLYRLSAPVVETLDSAVGKAWLKGISRKRLVTLMGALAKQEDKRLTIVDMHGTVSEAERARILNRALSEVLGSGAGADSAAERFIRDKQVGMDALVLIDPEKFELGEAGAVRAATLEEAMASTASRLGSHATTAGLGVIGFVLAAVSCRSVLAGMDTAQGAALGRAEANLLGQASGLTGAGFDAAGAVMEVYTARRMATQFGAYSEAMATRAAWCTGAGRLLGGFGGIIVGVVGVLQGIADAKEGHVTLGTFEGIGGLLGIASGVAVLAGALAFGLVVGLVAVLIMLLIGFFKQNPLQNWIEKGPLGDGQLQPFKNLVSQTMALQALPEG